MVSSKETLKKKKGKFNGKKWFNYVVNTESNFMFKLIITLSFSRVCENINNYIYVFSTSSYYIMPNLIFEEIFYLNWIKIWWLWTIVLCKFKMNKRYQRNFLNESTIERNKMGTIRVWYRLRNKWGHHAIKKTTHYI